MKALHGYHSGIYLQQQRINLLNFTEMSKSYEILESLDIIRVLFTLVILTLCLIFKEFVS